MSQKTQNMMSAMEAWQPPDKVMTVHVNVEGPTDVVDSLGEYTSTNASLEAKPYQSGKYGEAKYTANYYAMRGT
jgi:hypothetical protein